MARPAHSFLNGKRFYEARDLRAFLAGQAPEEDADPEMPAGGPEEYAMLALRLAEGLQEARYRTALASPFRSDGNVRRSGMPALGLTECWPEGFRFTRKGFLVSNALLAEILYET